MSLITLITVLVFAFLFWQVTPRVVKGIGGLNPANLLTNDQGTPISAVSDSTESGTPGVADGGALETPVPIVSPTPVRTCVKVTGTGNQGTPLRAEPKSSAASVIKDAKGKSLNVGEGAIFEVVGPDVTAGKDNAGKDIVWMHVLLPGDGRSGYALGKYLQPAPCP